MNSSLKAQLGKIRDQIVDRPCKDKRRYSKAGAQHVIALRQPHEPAKLRSYECPDCGAWHLTKKAEWVDL